MDDELGIAKAFMDLAARLMADPIKLAHAHVNLWTDYMSLWQSATMKMLGHNPSRWPPAQGDKRFRHEAWEDHFLFDYLKQSYSSRPGIFTMPWRGGGSRRKTRKKVNFYTRQYIDALSPANFALTNPEVFNETVRSGGQNLVKGCPTCWRT